MLPWHCVIKCPVGLCKHVSRLPSAGVRGLPTDHRIEQIRDLQATDGSDGQREALEQGVLEKYRDGEASDAFNVGVLVYITDL